MYEDIPMRVSPEQDSPVYEEIKSQNVKAGDVTVYTQCPAYQRAGVRRKPPSKNVNTSDIGNEMEPSRSVHKDKDNGGSEYEDIPTQEEPNYNLTICSAYGNTSTL